MRTDIALRGQVGGKGCYPCLGQRVRAWGVFLLLVLLWPVPASRASEQGRTYCGLCKQRIHGECYRLTREGRSMLICKDCARKLRAQKEAQAPRCSSCGKRITGKYVVKRQGEKKLVYCLACARQALPHCAECGLAIKGRGYRAQVDGKSRLLCEECMKRHLPRCAICGKTIFGKYTRIGDESYCQECLRLPRCPLCHRPIKPGTGVEKGGTSFCAGCAAKVKVCESCGKAILGKFYVHQFSGGTFCARCEQERPKCVSCGRPIKGEPVMLGGKRPMCRRCFRDCLLTERAVMEVFNEVRAMLARDLEMRVAHHLPVTIVDEIAEVQKGTGLAITGKERGLFKRKGEDYHIYVQYGLSRPLIYETLPHEFTHAWFAEHGHAKHPQWVEEGFCQWVASQVLTRKGKDFERGLKILQERSDLYGRGYRYIAAIAREGGRAAVFRYVASPPPPGKPSR